MDGRVGGFIQSSVLFGTYNKRHFFSPFYWPPIGRRTLSAKCTWQLFLWWLKESFFLLARVRQPDDGIAAESREEEERGLPIVISSIHCCLSDWLLGAFSAKYQEEENARGVTELYVVSGWCCGGGSGRCWCSRRVRAWNFADVAQYYTREEKRRGNCSPRGDTKILGLLSKPCTTRAILGNSFSSSSQGEKDVSAAPNEHVYKRDVPSPPFFYAFFFFFFLYAFIFFFFCLFLCQVHREPWHCLHHHTQ